MAHWSSWQQSFLGLSPRLEGAAEQARALKAGLPRNQARQHVSMVFVLTRPGCFSASRPRGPITDTELTTQISENDSVALEPLNRKRTCNGVRVCDRGFVEKVPWAGPV